MKSIFKIIMFAVVAAILYNLGAANTLGTTGNNVATKTAAPAQVYGVYIGMTEDQLWRSMWGKPTSINRTVTANNIREQWVYRGGKQEGYIYLTNGVVTAIQE